MLVILLNWGVAWWKLMLKALHAFIIRWVKTWEHISTIRYCSEIIHDQMLGPTERTSCGRKHFENATKNARCYCVHSTTLCWTVSVSLDMAWAKNVEQVMWSALERSRAVTMDKHVRGGEPHRLEISFKCAPKRRTCRIRIYLDERVPHAATRRARPLSAEPAVLGDAWEYCRVTTREKIRVWKRKHNTIFNRGKLQIVMNKNTIIHYCSFKLFGFVHYFSSQYFIIIKLINKKTNVYLIWQNAKSFFSYYF